jgi:hypothetical protein
LGDDYYQFLGQGLVPEVHIRPAILQTWQFSYLGWRNPASTWQVVWVVRKETFASMRKYCESRFWA